MAVPVFNIEAGESPLRVIRFSGHEAISSPFEFRVDAAGVGIDPEALLGQPATLTIDGVESPRIVHGLVSEAEYVGHSRQWDLYALTITPWVHRLLHQTNCRIFQNKTTEQIITEILRKAGLLTEHFQFSLADSYAPRDYCAQYRESDFAFVSRLLEEDGIFYFFEHTANKHVWIMADHPQAHVPIVGGPKLWFSPPMGTVQDHEHVQRFRFGGRLRPGKVTLRDFDLQRPDMDMEVTEVGKIESELEHYDFPGEYQDPRRGGPHQGQSMAKIRLAELQATRRLGAGDSDCPRLQPGRSMTLAGHPRHELNTEYRIIKVTHTGSQPQVLDQDASGESSYSNSFTVTELKVLFRPARETRRPVVRGLQTATVVGPASEEVHVDQHGRVRIQFHWDRHGKHDEHSTTWVPVGQLWAGNGYGAMFIPRIGHEVLVDFLEGDPDRPLVVGRIYHGQNGTPYPLPEEKTKSTIRSESSPGGGGFNELSFEDRKGAEEVFLHAQKNMNTMVLNDLSEQVGANRRVTVGDDDATLVGAVHTVTIGRASEPAGMSASTELKMQEGFYSVTTGGARLVLNGSDIFLIAEGNITLAAGGEVSVSSGGPMDLSGGGPATVSAGGDLVIKGSMIRLNPP